MTETEHTTMNAHILRSHRKPALDGPQRNLTPKPMAMPEVIADMSEEFILHLHDQTRTDSGGSPVFEEVLPEMFESARQALAESSRDSFPRREVISDCGVAIRPHLAPVTTTSWACEKWDHYGIND